MTQFLQHQPNQRYTYDADTNTLHRFYNGGNGICHWSDSTNQGANSINGSQVPNDIKNIFDLPKKGGNYDIRKSV